MPKILLTKDGKYVLAGGVSISITLPSSTGTPLSSLALTDFFSANTSAYPVIQRKAGTTLGDVPVLFTYTGGDANSPANVQARVLGPTGAVVKDWTNLSTVTVSNGTGLGTLTNVPQGVKYQLQIRDSLQSTDTNFIKTGSQYWGIGVVILVEGQSNMVGTFSASYTDIVTGSTNEYSYWNGTTGSMFATTSGFDSPAANTGSNITNAAGGIYKLLRISAEALEAKYGYKVPVAVVPCAYGGRGIGTWQTGGEAYNTLFAGAPSASPFNGTFSFKSAKNIYAGDFEIIVFHQGENDATSTMTRAIRREQLKSYFQLRLDYVAPFGRNATTLWFLPALLGTYGGTQYIEAIRQGIFELEAYAKTAGWTATKLGWNCIDLDASLDSTTGGLHFANATGKPFVKWSFMRMMQSILYALGCATWSGAGPRVDMTSATRQAGTDTITVKVVHERPTATLKLRNTGAAMTGWVANTQADFSGTDITVTSQSITAADTMQLTLSLPAGVTYASGVYIKLLGGQIGYANSYHPAIDNLPVDDSVIPSAGGKPVDSVTDGLPVVPTDAIKIN